MLQNIGVLVLPTLVSVPKANTVFGPAGELNDPSLQKRLDAQAGAYAQLLQKLV